MDDVRNYGLGKPPRPEGRPVAKPVDPKTHASILAGGGCPNCACEEIMEITVTIKHARLAGGIGEGKYLGCPACPWASPMVIAARGTCPKCGGDHDERRIIQMFTGDTNPRPCDRSDYHGEPK